MFIIRTKFLSDQSYNSGEKLGDQSGEINHNPNCPDIPDHPYRILIIGGSGSGKTVLLNLMKQQPDIDKNCFFVKDPFEPNYQLLINGREKVGIETLKKSKNIQ